MALFYSEQFQDAARIFTYYTGIVTRLLLPFLILLLSGTTVAAGGVALEVEEGRASDPALEFPHAASLLPWVGQDVLAESWRLDIEDPKGRLAQRFEGEGRPPLRILWAGADRKGGLAADGDYSASLTVRGRDGSELSGPPAAFRHRRPRALAEIERTVVLYEDARSLAIQLPLMTFEGRSLDIAFLARRTLSRVGDFLRQSRTASPALVLGYNDRTGPDGERPVSQKRAHVVYSFLVSDAGIPPERLRFRGLGDREPSARIKTLARKKDRRVEVWLYKSAAAAAPPPAASGKTSMLPGGLLLPGAAQAPDTALTRR